MTAGESTTGHLDRCPACVATVAEPWRIVAAAYGTREHYQCCRCGYRWHTSWMHEAVSS